MKWAEDTKREAEEEIRREIERDLEDLECTMADINGDGTCARRDRDAEMEACWSQDGMTWDWDSKQCMTWEEQE